MSADRRWREGLDGQGLVEYSMILLLVALAVFASLTLLGPAVQGFFEQAVKAFPA